MSGTASKKPDAHAELRTCHCCGLAQVVPRPPKGMRARCPRCHTAFRRAAADALSNSRTAAIAVSALILYPLAVGLPILEIQQFGYRSESSILDGTATLLANGHLFVGLVVLFCSVVFPLMKLFGLLALSAGGSWLERRHRARTYHLIEWTGRWGMLDVLAVAVLVAVVKLGQTVDLTPGPGAAAFTAVVILSLVASASFNPHALWHAADVGGGRNEAGAKPA